MSLRRNDYPDQKQLLEKWSSILDHPGLPKIKDLRKRSVTATLLENTEGAIQETRQALMEAGHANVSAGMTGTYMKGFDPVLISLVRRSAPNLIAFDLCGVQPMTMPTGLVFALKARYSTQGGTEALFNEADTAFSGTGTQAGTAPLPQANADAYKAGTAMSTTSGEALGDPEGTDWAEMGISIESMSVTAKTRALKAEYTIELQQDLKAVHGLDAEAELSNVLSTQILTDQNREVVRTIANNAKPGAQHNVTAAGIFDLNTDSNGRWAVEKFKGLMFQIERDANAIAKDTRRGRGNFLLTSSDVASALSIAGLLDSSGLEDNLSYDGDCGATLVGTLNKRFKVYVDPYVAAASINYYIVGYKGPSSFDAGLFYCPYVPLQLLKAVDPDMIQPKIGFKTRYGLVSNPFANSNGDGSLVWNQNCYYRKVQVNNLM